MWYPLHNDSQILISRAFLPPQLQVRAPLWGCFRKVPNRTFIKLKSQNVLPFSVGISVNATNVHSVAQAKAWVILVSFLSLPLYIKLIIKSYWLCLFRCTWICWLVFVIYATPLVHHLPATLQPWLSNSSAFHQPFLSPTFFVLWSELSENRSLNDFLENWLSNLYEKGFLRQIRNDWLKRTSLLWLFIRTHHAEQHIKDSKKSCHKGIGSEI